MAENLPAWESLIAERMRPAATVAAIEDPVKRNAKNAKKAWCKRNPERVKANKKAWNEANPEKIKIYQERNKKNVKAWALAHPERVRELGRKSNARRRSDPVRWEKRQKWSHDYQQRPEVKEKALARDRARNKDPQRMAQNRASHARCKARKKVAALFLILLNIPTIKEAA